ncbi:MAG: cobalamin biosynthesis protein CbiX [Actinobacteria bacterium]|nr:cobalamin biosynthesis protein CbiX [Actinomycetota bacterium]
MKGIMIAAHGSRRLETEQTLDTIAEKVREKSGAEHLSLGFMEFSDRTFEKALDELVDAGCDDILVIPYFLFTGMHLKHDIPEMLEAYRSEHPDIDIRMGHTLGSDDRLVAIVADQVEGFLTSAGER